MKSLVLVLLVAAVAATAEHSWLRTSLTEVAGESTPSSASASATASHVRLLRSNRNESPAGNTTDDEDKGDSRKNEDAPDDPEAPNSKLAFLKTEEWKRQEGETTSNDEAYVPSATNFLLEGAWNLTDAFNFASINATAISLTACEQIEMAVEFLTSLDFDQDFWKMINFSTVGKTQSTNSQKFGAIWELYLFQIILAPISVMMTFFGSNLLHPTCCLAAATIGVFLVFHVVNFMNNSRSPILHTISLTIDCQMKLAFSLISAIIAAMLASTCLRFGLFSLGALAAGSTSYLIFDAFPFLDPMRETLDDNHSTQQGQPFALHGQMNSELSPFGWIITTLVGVAGGIFLRWYEQASLEIVTAAMGGLGCAYSLHTFFILQGGTINRSLVFLIANFVAFSGWRFQRHRRLYRTEYAHKKHDQYSTVQLLEPQSVANWDQLQASINQALQRHPGAGQPTELQILELTNSLNSLLTRMETTHTSAPAASNPTEKT